MTSQNTQHRALTVVSAKPPAPMAHVTCRSLRSLHEQLRAHPDQQIRIVGADGKLLTKSYAELHDEVVRMTDALGASGLGADDLVGILAANCYDWIVADLALLASGCVSVGLPVASKGDGDDPEQLAEKYRLSAVLLGRDVPLATTAPAWIARLGHTPFELRKRHVGASAPTLPGDVFTIAFSSGTAGTKKGLLLTESGVLNTIDISSRAWGVDKNDDILVVMPFSAFQQRYLVYLAISAGSAITLMPPERMFQKMKVLEPTIIVGPPSFFEIAYNRVRSAGRRDKVSYFVAAMLHAVAPDGLTRRLRTRLGRKWTSLYGSRVRLMLTGSAPVPPKLVTLFHRLGAPLFEVYGSTEIGWIAFNTPNQYRIGRAGRPVDGVGICIADDGEVLVRPAAPQAVGYVFEGEETQRAVFLDDGTIATGDLGRFDHAGFLQLIGRKKNVIITRSGVKINPEELERDIESSCQLTKVLVVSTENGSALTCIAWMDEWQSPGRRQAVEEYVGHANTKREESHRVAHIVFRPGSELTVESGLLTRNLKVDREAARKMLLMHSTGEAQ